MNETKKKETKKEYKTPVIHNLGDAADLTAGSRSAGSEGYTLCLGGLGWSNMRPTHM